MNEIKVTEKKFLDSIHSAIGGDVELEKKLLTGFNKDDEGEEKCNQLKK